MSGHTELLELMRAVQADVAEVKTDVKAQNSRVRTCELELGRLSWAVFVGGAGVVGTVAWLVMAHLKT